MGGKGEEGGKVATGFGVASIDDGEEADTGEVSVGG